MVGLSAFAEASQIAAPAGSTIQPPRARAAPAIRDALATPVAAAQDTAPASTGKPSALVVFAAPSPASSARAESDAIERQLASIPALSTGILSATQGVYKPGQLLLDITQGARVSYSAYSPTYPPALALTVHAPRPEGAPARARARAPRGSGVGASSAAVAGAISSWTAARKRAEEAPQLLIPGLLSSSIPGGGAYAGVVDVPTLDSVLVADRAGAVAAVSLGSASSLLDRIHALQASHSLVAADLPSGRPGYADLRTLVSSRPAGELLVVVQRAREAPGNELLWIALAGLGGGGGTLTSQTTDERGMVAAIDIGPTILAHLGLNAPADMRGNVVRTDGGFEGAALRNLMARLETVASRRMPALVALLGAWALLLVAALLSSGGDRRRGAWALRVGALAALWSPVAVLVPAALEPSTAGELALIVAVALALGALTDLLAPWPRAPALVALVAVTVLVVDALAGTQLLMRSVLGPNPAFGARFYGIGNELKSGLAVLALAGVAAALSPAVRGRRAALSMACAGIALAVVEGSARIGAGVGGVILVSAGTAVATLLLLPGALSRKRALIAMAAPVIGLVGLAALDLATAKGAGHFTGSVLDARSPADIKDIIVRRYSAAWDELKNHLMPLATALALVASAIAVRRRDRVLAPVSSDPAWTAALAGGLTAGVIGALTEDSGPELLVVAVFALACVLAYVWGRPRPRPVDVVDSRQASSGLPADATGSILTTSSRSVSPSKSSGLQV